MSGRRVRARYGVCGIGARTRGADPKSEGRDPKEGRGPKSEIRRGDVPEDAEATFVEASARQGEFNSSSALILR